MIMVVKTLPVNFSDHRGTIRDVLKTKVETVTLITAKVGSVRGNHYHLKATVHVYVLTGKFLIRSRYEEKLEDAVVQAGQLVTFPPMDLHALVALEDSSFLIMGDGPRGGDLTVAEVLYAPGQYPSR